MNASLTQLRHFIALAESGSFTAAAHSSHRSQAAFSRSIAVLEARLGVRLVDRIGHANELTPLGRLVLEHARHVVAEADSLQRAIDVQARGGAGVLRLGLAPTPAAVLTTPLLDLAARRHRALRVVITDGRSDMLLQALQQRQFDALVLETGTVLATPDLQVESLAFAETGLLCRPGHPLLRRRALSLDDLLRYPIACTSLSDDRARAMITRFGPRAHPSSLISLCCEDVLSLLAAARSSDALYLGTLVAGRAFVERGELFRLPFDTAGFRTHYAMVRLAGRWEPPVLAEVRAMARTLLHER